MTTIEKKKPVMVTGATGYVAGWLVKELLANGHTVHAPVRNPDRKESVQHLEGLAAEHPGTIVFFKADLLEPGSYDEAMHGCELVYHTASPFTSKIKDPQKDLVDPALLGTRNVLESANRTQSVKRVVLTSSCAAIVGDAQDTLDIPNGIATEENWNETSTLDHQAYSYSKTVAEREAWKMAEAQSRWDLVVVNPSFVLGPGINPKSTSESFNVIKQIGDGTMKIGVPDMQIGIIDVRDLGLAHYRAGFTPEAKGRHIVSADTRSFLELAKALREKFGDAYPFPKKTVPKWLLWMIGPLFGLKRKMVSRNMGYPWQVDNSKSKATLKMSYRSPEDSIVDFFQQMIDNGVFGRREEAA